MKFIEIDDGMMVNLEHVTCVSEGDDGWTFLDLADGNGVGVPTAYWEIRERIREATREATL